MKYTFDAMLTDKVTGLSVIGSAQFLVSTISVTNPGSLTGVVGIPI